MGQKPSKICDRHPLKNLKWYGLLRHIVDDRSVCFLHHLTFFLVLFRTISIWICAVSIAISFSPGTTFKKLFDVHKLKSQIKLYILLDIKYVNWKRHSVETYLSKNVYSTMITLIYIYYPNIYICIYINWNSLYGKLKSHYEAWSYKKKKPKKVKAYRKSG